MEGNIEFVTLAPGDDVIATAEHEKFAYFKIIVSDNSDMLTLRADPANDESDPDIYVSNHSKEVGQDKYTWKSTNVGADRLDIHPEDEKYVIGEYYMAVFAYRPGLNTFRIRCDVTPCPSYTILEDKEKFTGMLKEHDTAYHRAKIMNAGESRIEVTVTPGKHVTAVFASSNVLYPSLDEHQWSVGIYDLDPAYTRSNRVAEAIVDVDPFDNFMQKQYTRKPTARELENFQKIKELKDLYLSDELAEGTEEESSAPVDGSEPLVFWVETDEWVYSKDHCYFAIQNQTDSPLEYTLTYREIIEKELLPAELRQQCDLFTELFEQIEGSAVSQSERKRLKVSGKSEFTYGEVEYVHMLPIFEMCNYQPGQVFWDLGCGAGKCMLAAAFAMPDLKEINGVEYLEGVYNCAVQAGERFRKVTNVPMNIIHGDMLEVDWSDADLIFTSSICFPQELIDGIWEKAKLLKIGTKIVSLKSFDDCDDWEIIHNLRVKMTWGKTGVYILEKIK